MTRRIKEAGDLLGIKVLDHLIFSPPLLSITPWWSTGNFRDVFVLNRG